MYWPVSIFLQSPFLTEKSKKELLSIGQPGSVLSVSAVETCHQIASQSPHNGKSLVLMHSEGTPSRRVYIQHPDSEDWLALERGGFVATHLGFGFTLDELH